MLLACRELQGMESGGWRRFLALGGKSVVVPSCLPGHPIRAAGSHPGAKFFIGPERSASHSNRTRDPARNIPGVPGADGDAARFGSLMCLQKQLIRLACR